MKYAPYAPAHATTNLGTISIEVPRDWKGEALADNPFGEWVFDHPDDVCTLYIRTRIERIPPPGTVEQRIDRLMMSHLVAHQITYREVDAEIDVADGGRHFRATYIEEDSSGDVAHFERQRLVDAGPHGIVSIRFILAHDALLRNESSTDELRAFVAAQFDRAVIQLLQTRGYNTSADPSALWRTSTFDVGNGHWTFRRPIGWTFSAHQGSEQGTTAWRADSADGKWELYFQRAIFPLGNRSPEQAGEDLFRRMMDVGFTALAGPPDVERLPSSIIIKVRLTNNATSLNRGDRWYIIRKTSFGVILFRITFSRRDADAATPAGQSLLRFCREMVKEAASSKTSSAGDTVP